MPNDLRSELNELIKERENLEAEAEAIRSFLLAPGPNGAAPPGLRGTPLVDDEGFPRADIDVYDVRCKRHRLACIDTDYEALMKRIEELVKEIHEEARLKGAVRPESTPTTTTTTTAVRTGAAPARAPTTAMEVVATAGEEEEEDAALRAAEPFALVDQVFRSSPAEEAGLKEGDLLLAVGSVNAGNHDNFSAVVRLVQDSVGRPLTVAVRRKQGGGAPKNVTLTLTPHAWSGRGLLGCHLSPLSS